MRRGGCTRGFALALVLGACVGGLAPAGAIARRPTKLPTRTTPGKKLRHAPSCEAFEGTVLGFQLGHLKGPSVTPFGAHGTTCAWSGQESGKYAFVVSVAVFGAPAEVGKRLLAVAQIAARKANSTPGGLGLVASKNPRRGNYFEGEAVYSEETADKETEKCPPFLSPSGEELGPNTTIEAGQSAPSCAGQPGTEGDFLTAYGSPRPNVEPTLLQVGVACQQDALSRGVLSLAHLASAFYGGRGY
ncbi:MAG: hypothetical protein ACLPUT_13425 [Solirubrobacteraceae bacterium]